MSNASFYLAATIILLTSFPLAVQAQSFCLKREDMVKELKDQFHEIPISIGIIENKILEIFSSPNGRTFTIVFTTKEGITCPIVAGRNLVNLPVKPKNSHDTTNQAQTNG
jgi:hypothetical protein